MKTKTRMIAVTIALATMTGFAGPAPAQQSQAVTWCNATEANGVSLDQQISGCTTVIQAGKESKTNLASAFSNRGIAYADKGQYDRAIQDYDQAIKLNPNEAAVFNNRGNAYANKGQYDRAIQDYDQAIRLNPKDAKAFNNRGFTYANKGQYDRAIEDYDQAIKLNPNYTEAINRRAEAVAKKQ